MADLAVAGDRAGRGAALARCDRSPALPKRSPPRATAACCGCRCFSAPASRVYFTLTVEPPLWLGLAAAFAAASPGACVAAPAGAWREAALALAFCRRRVCAGCSRRAGSAARRCWSAASARSRSPAGSSISTIARSRLAHRHRARAAAGPCRGRAAAPPARAHRAEQRRLRPGDRVSLKAVLYPVPAQVMPGGRDMQRELYFAGIGAVGYSFGAARRIARRRGRAARRLARMAAAAAHRDDPPDRRRAARLDRRRRLGGHHRQTRHDRRGGQAGVSRNSGLSHLLAIAGLHLGLVGGFVFFAVRGGLALIPLVALRWPIKKIAALLTLLVLFCYLMISGAAIPTQRAFVMNGIVFAAILIDRLRISMRICALAAMVVLLLDPPSLVGVSFQMSFGAVVALIAVYETWGARLARLFHRGSFARKVLGYCGARRGHDGGRDARHRAVLDLPFPPPRRSIRRSPM